MYPDKKYMNDTEVKDLKFTPLSSEILNNLYNPLLIRCFIFIEFCYFPISFYYV